MNPVIPHQANRDEEMVAAHGDPVQILSASESPNPQLQCNFDAKIRDSNS